MGAKRWLLMIIFTHRPLYHPYPWELDDTQSRSELGDESKAHNSSYISVGYLEITRVGAAEEISHHECWLLSVTMTLFHTHATS
jgi:hypothetical protein